MTSRDFCFWLQGYFEVAEGAERCGRDMTIAQVETIKRHLALVFKHEIDPSMSEPAPKTAHEEHLDAAHRPQTHPSGKAPVFRC
jgi:hypothetical protein